MSTLSEAPIAARPQTAQVMVSVAEQRQIAEVQAAIMSARRFPRDPKGAIDRIIAACSRPELARAALYSYNRGGSDVTGPSIRLAEAIAQNWGNMEFGIRELEQRDGESTVEAFAIDLETNTRQVKVFQVPHVRFTKKGGRTALEDPRDIYEMTANQGARRLRACILGIVPGDVIDAAVEQVELTLKTQIEVTPERIQSMLEVFADLGVTKAMVEARIGRRVESITPALMVNMGKIVNSLRDGMSSPGDWFDLSLSAGGEASEQAPATRTEQVKDRLRAAVESPKAPEKPEGAGPGAPEQAPAEPGESAPEASPADDDDDPTMPFTEASDKRIELTRLAKILGAWNESRSKLVISANAAKKLGVRAGEYGVSEAPITACIDDLLALMREAVSRKQASA